MDKEASGFNTKQTVAIVGLGLIGGSYARGLRRIGPMKKPSTRLSRKAWSMKSIRLAVRH